ncbi:MAG: alpha/beta fold hydrolase, partial [Phycisphaerales bacterium]|nr:alpha/beta fold hydrolase [Phycisphaerales bacterium]
LGVITEAWMRLTARPRWRIGASFHLSLQPYGTEADQVIHSTSRGDLNLRLLDAAEAALVRLQQRCDRVVVMGLSMGGYVTFEFVRRHARRVRALVLADTQSAADTPEKAASRMEGAARVLVEGNQWVVDGMTPILFAEDAPKALVQEWREIMLATNPQGTAAGMRAMADRIDSATTFAQIQCPTLVVVGELDAITPPKAARIMSDGIDGARLEILPGVGHMAPVEAPDEYARIVGDFLSENT